MKNCGKRHWTHRISSILLLTFTLESIQPAWASGPIRGQEIRTGRSEAVELLSELYTRLEADYLKRNQTVVFQKEVEIENFLSSLTEEDLPRILSFLKGLHTLVTPTFRTEELPAELLADEFSEDLLESDDDEPTQIAFRRQIANFPEDASVSQLIALLKEKWDRFEKFRCPTFTPSCLSDDNLEAVTILLSLVAEFMGTLLSIEYCRDSNDLCIFPDLNQQLNPNDPSQALKMVAQIAMASGTMFFLSLVIIKKLLRESGDLSLRFSHWYANRQVEKELETLDLQTHQWTHEMSEKYHIRHLSEFIQHLINPRALLHPAWNEDPECPICFEEYQNNSDATVTPCGHKFHHECLKPILQSASNRRCPMCRLQLNPR